MTVSVQTSGKERLILDLSHINLHVFKQKFKCEGPHTIRDIFSKYQFSFAFSFDLKSGYHHVDIFPEHRAFLAFSWDFGTGVARYFQFTVLPFGLPSALFILTKLLKPLETLWRIHGIPVAIFFNDGVGAGQSVEAANHNSSVVRTDLTRAGFQINHEKSDWQPKSCFSWIGYTIDTYSIRGSFAQQIAELKSFFPSLLIFVSLWRSLALFTLRELPPLSVKLFHYLLAAVQLLKL